MQELKSKQIASNSEEKYFIGFRQEPIGLEQVLSMCGFNYSYTCPIDFNGTMAAHYSPDSAHSNRPVFRFVSTPVYDWKNVTSDQIVSEASISIGYPVEARLWIMYHRLAKELGARFDFVVD